MYHRSETEEKGGKEKPLEHIESGRSYMNPHIDTMRENIAKALLIDVGQVNVKATTEEGLGFTGSGEGISSQAICLVTTPYDLTAQAVQGGCGSCGGCPKS